MRPFGHAEYELPSNVENALNVFQLNGEPFQGGFYENCQSCNRDMTNPGVDHGNIVTEGVRNYESEIRSLFNINR